jgi:hypothetical protein
MPLCLFLQKFRINIEFMNMCVKTTPHIRGSRKEEYVCCCCRSFLHRRRADLGTCVIYFMNIDPSRQLLYIS